MELDVLNPERVSVLDVDFDIEGSRRQDVLNKFREVYGIDRVANVVTFGTEKSKSAILTAARGLGIDVDIAQYISSMIPADRGQLRTLHQVFYGDEEKGFSPNRQFVFEMTENYPELWKVAQKIEGLICRTGLHAGGIVFVDEPFTNSTALMRAPDGTICTQFELHDLEDASLIKYDALSVEAMDKIHTCIDLICDNGYAERKATLKETYESLIGIYNLERTAPEMWKMIWEHKITSLFQMEQQSGVQGIALTHPESVDDLATLNSVIRLMAQEKGAEQPLNKYARFKENIEFWYKEMDDYGLTKEEQQLLEPIIKISYGMCESQERFMQLVQLPECGGFSLVWADKLRKSIAKKNPAEYESLAKEFFKVTKEKKCSKNLCNYVWNVLIATSKGYGFNLSHTLAYSLVALQEMNLAYKYPIIFWNCANLIVDSKSNIDENEKEKDKNEEENFEPVNYNSNIETFNEIEKEYDEEDEDGYEITIVVDNKGRKKKKVKSTNYGKIATAIGKLSNEGIKIYPPDINKSEFTFSPDVNKNIIRYGMSGIAKIGEELVHLIIDNRPYNSIEDFLSKVKINKPQMVNLIKSGAFDEFGDRVNIMKKYIVSISDVKKRVTLQNMKMLIDFNLIPEKYDLQKKVYNFNKYLKKFKEKEYYLIDNIAMNFIDKNFDIDNLEEGNSESGFKILQIKWDKIYKKQMDIIRPFIQKNNENLLDSINKKLIKDMWDKYCSGSVSKWEMDSISCYFHKHELNNVNLRLKNCTNFFELDKEPEVERIINIKGKQIPIFKINRIAGTILDKDKNKKIMTLLTNQGVVNVKIYGDVFNKYDRQISEKDNNGIKHTIEKSWLSRGNKIIITGIRKGDFFISKKYSQTPYHLLELIIKINDDGTLETRTNRIGDEDE